MYTIAVMLQKGGGGKSTLCVNLAVAAAQAGKTPLIIDVDPQATSCKWFDRRQAGGHSAYPAVIDAQPARLEAAIAKARQSGINFVLIDTPARSEQAALAAARVADLVIYPCRPQAYDLETVPSTLEVVQMSGSRRAFAVLNAVQPFGDRHEQSRAFLKKLGVDVCPQTIGNRAAFGDAGAIGKSILELDPNNKGSQEIIKVYNYTCRMLGKSTIKHGQK